MASSSVQRFVHSTGWFADVPASAMAFLDPQTSTIRLCAGDAREPPPPPAAPRQAAASYVDLRGIVVQTRDDWVVASCNGLVVSAPGALAIGTHVLARLS